MTNFGPQRDEERERESEGVKRGGEREREGGESAVHRSGKRAFRETLNAQKENKTWECLRERERERERVKEIE